MQPYDSKVVSRIFCILVCMVSELNRVWKEASFTLAPTTAAWK